MYLKSFSIVRGNAIKRAIAIVLIGEYPLRVVVERGESGGYLWGIDQDWSEIEHYTNKDREYISDGINDLMLTQLTR